MGPHFMNNIRLLKTKSGTTHLAVHTPKLVKTGPKTIAENSKNGFGRDYHVTTHF